VTHLLVSSSGCNIVLSYITIRQYIQFLLFEFVWVLLDNPQNLSELPSWSRFELLHISTRHDTLYPHVLKAASAWLGVHRLRDLVIDTGLVYLYLQQVPAQSRCSLRQLIKLEGGPRLVFPLRLIECNLHQVLTATF
jgi:hypothetical protein